MSAPERTLITKFVADRDYLRIDETVPTFIAAGQEALDAIKAKFSPSSERPCRAYDQDAGEFKVCLGEEWLDENNVIVVNGVGYERSGTFVKTVQANQWVTRSGVHIHQADVTLPVQPPGWVYVFNCVGSSPTLWPTIQVAARNNNVIMYTIRIQRNEVPDFAAMFRASWELIKDTAG